MIMIVQPILEGDNNMNNNDFSDIDKKLAVLNFLANGDEEIVNTLIKDIEVKEEDILIEELLDELEN